MTRRPSLSPPLVASACLIALALGGCGRKGGLEPPPDPAVQARSDDGDAKPKKVKKIPIKPPTKPFILDPLV